MTGAMLRLKTTSTSLEKLMVEEADESAPDFSSSGGISSRSSMSVSPDDKPLDLPSSWSFEGEPNHLRKIKQTDKHKCSDSSNSDSEHNVGRCVIGCAADCTALACCPLAVFNILAVLCYKFPLSICRRISRRLKKRKKRKPIAERPPSEPFIYEQAFSPASDWKPSSPVPLPDSIQQGFGFGGHHLWREFDSAQSSLCSP